MRKIYIKEQLYLITTIIGLGKETIIGRYNKININILNFIFYKLEKKEELLIKLGLICKKPDSVKVV